MSETQPRRGGAGIDRGPAGARITLLLASAGFFLITLDILIINAALTQIGRELGGGTAGQQWVIDGYTLLFASLLLCAGSLADRIGAKRGLRPRRGPVRPDLGRLCARPDDRRADGHTGRPWCGGGGDVARVDDVDPGSLPDPGRRARAVAAALGPLLGGVLTTLDWRWVFGVNVPVCVAMLALVSRVGASPTRSMRFDRAGQVLGMLALAGLTFGLIEGGADGFGSPPAIGSLVIAAASLVGFVIVEGPVEHPMMPLELFLPAGMRIAVAVGFAFTAPLGSPLLTTLLIVPIGAGGSLAVPPATGLVLAGAVPERAGAAGAAFNTFRQVGGAMAIAVFGALIADRAEFIAGLQACLTIAAGLLLATVAVSLRIRPTRPR